MAFFEFAPEVKKRTRAKASVKETEPSDLALESSTDLSPAT
jgi:hypothetical protein